MASSSRKSKRPRAEGMNDRELYQEDRSQETSEPSSKRAKTNRSLFIRSLPPGVTSETLTEFFSQHFPVKHATVVVDRNTQASKGFGFVTLADEDDAADAKEKLDNELWDGRRIRVEVAEPRQRQGGGPQDGSKVTNAKQEREAMLEKERKTKLIIRNLPWSIKKPEQLNKLFQSYGKILYTDLPQNKGKLKGFGFITIRGRKNAQKAMDAMNGKKIDGRTIAVDWAVDKDEWDRLQRKENAEGEIDDDEKSDSASTKDSEADANKGPQSQADADLEEFMRNHLNDLEDEPSEDEENDEEEEEDGNEKENIEGIEGKRPSSSGRDQQQTTDNSSTIFVRNLAYTATDEDLKMHFSVFGPVRYARIVKDKATDKPAGTGFVCFFKEADSRACVVEAPRPEKATSLLKHSILRDEGADPQGRYTMDGRLLLVSRAVGKDEAAKLGIGSSKQKDKRRLFLLNEGHIDSRSPMHALLTPSEIKMRETSAAQRKKMVEKNPTLHLSLTRLAIRNIPKNITSKGLKELARQAIVGFAKDVKDGRRQALSREETSRAAKEAKEAEHQRKVKGKGVVSQAKIVFETTEGSKIPEGQGGGRSRGYGFIEYSSHRWALMGLRWLNGHQLQDDKGKKQRLVVEFAIENVQVVKRRTDLRQGKPRAREGEDARAAAGSANKSGINIRNGKMGLSEENRAGPNQALQQKLIARKRMVRKKKAMARNGK